MIFAGKRGVGGEVAVAVGEAIRVLGSEFLGVSLESLNNRGIGQVRACVARSNLSASILVLRLEWMGCCLLGGCVGVLGFSEVGALTRGS